MDLKKIAKALLFPHVAILIALFPVATVLLTGSMLFVGSNTPIAYASYAIAFYTLTVFCIRIPRLIAFFKTVKRENRYAKKWFSDPRLRVNVSLYGFFFWNMAYALLQLWLGFYHHTVWFYTFGAYYALIAVMRLFLLRHTQKYAPGEQLRQELIKYRACGWIFLVMNLALCVIVFFMIYWNRTFHHHKITTIALAAYTFTTLTVAIVGIVRYRKYQSPVFIASKATGLVAALVSLLTLESTMLTTFGKAMTAAERKWMLGATGAAIAAAIVAVAIYLIVTGTKKLKALRQEVENGK